MNYISTRGGGEPLGFAEAVLRGLADDGGLFVPERWPQLAEGEIAALAGQPFEAVADRVIAPFAADALAQQTLREMTSGAMSAFSHPAKAPLVQIDSGHFLLELFHGPTLAFKDVAMQFLARLLDHILEERGVRTTLIVATSGDTGAAAAEAFRGRRAIDLVVLYPDGRISEVQRRQMTTVAAGNVHAIAIDGTFDDCQALVKAMFMDTGLRHDLNLSGVNSINWARIVAQISYYFVAAVALGAPHRRVSFSVPTGNFGDIFAGYAALRMGLPVERLVIATNTNDILHRMLQTGRYAKGKVTATSSPSMDIQVASNFERLIFEATGRNAGAVGAMMDQLVQTGGFELPDAALAAIREAFASAAVSEAETAATIEATRKATGIVVDPHTAVGIAAARAHASGEAPMITLATAHPAKFPDAVERACGSRPQLPPRLRAMMDAPERLSRLPAEFAAVSARVRELSRAAEAAAA